jgi:hypothetical protein
MESKARLAVLAVLFGSSLLYAQQETALTMECKVPRGLKVTSLIFHGGAPLPDGTVLSFNIQKVSEYWDNGQITKSMKGVTSGLAEIEGKKYTYDPAVDGPSTYFVIVTLIDDFQRRTIIEKLKKVDPRQWQFEFAGWGDELIPSLSPRMQEVDDLAREAGELTKKFEKACESPTGWIQDGKDLVKEGQKLLLKIEKAECRHFFPAAWSQIYYTLRNILGNAPYFAWKDGKFAGAVSYHANNESLKTFRQEPFKYENFRRYIEESVPLAGREFALWAVKELRRTNAALRPPILDALKKDAKHPGFDVFEERLEKATPQDADVLEKDVRGTKLEVKEEKK